MRGVVLLGSVLVACAAVLRPWGAPPAFACSAGPDFNPVADSSLIVAGRITGWDLGEPVRIDPPLAGAPAVPLRIMLAVDRVLKGPALREVTVLDFGTVTAERLARTRYPDLGVGVGGCAVFDTEDPTDQYVIVGLFRSGDGSYVLNRLLTFYIGDAPAGPAYEAALQRIAFLGQDRWMAAGSPPASVPAPRVAFLRGGDVYVLDPATGREQRLTDDGRSAAPMWTADGRTLLFHRASPGPAEQWRWREDTGLLRAAVGPGAAVWTPDGMAAAVVDPPSGRWQPQPGWTETRVLLVKDGGVRPVTPAEPGARWEPLGWSPDGRRLALLRLALGSPSGGLPAPLLDASLWVTDNPLDPAAARRLALPLPARAGPGQPDIPDVTFWSPDGRFLTLGMGPGIPCGSCRADGASWWLVPVDGGGPVELASAITIMPALAWSLTGAFVVQSAPAGRETYRQKQLVRTDPATGARTDLSRDPAWSDVEPAVSPDGRTIAFVRGPSTDGPLAPTPTPGGLHPNVAAIAARRLWVMAPDGTNARQITDAPGWTDETPAWSPDGQWLIFVRWRPAGAGGPAAAQLWAVRPDGRDPHPLVTDLDLPPAFTDGFGYYGALRWDTLVAVTPALVPGVSSQRLPAAGAPAPADAGAGGAASGALAPLLILAAPLALAASHRRRRRTRAMPAARADLGACSSPARVANCVCRNAGDPGAGDHGPERRAGGCRCVRDGRACRGSRRS